MELQDKVKTVLEQLHSIASTLNTIKENTKEGKPDTRADVKIEIDAERSADRILIDDTVPRNIVGETSAIDELPVVGQVGQIPPEMLHLLWPRSSGQVSVSKNRPALRATCSSQKMSSAV